MSSGKLIITIQEAIAIAKRWMKQRGVELPDDLRAVLWCNDWVIQPQHGEWVYVNSNTGEVMQPNIDIRYTTFRDPAPDQWADDRR